MARNNPTRPRQRTQVSTVVDSANLSVVAPLTAPLDTSKAEQWASLSNALGVASKAMGQAKAANDKEAVEAGMADRQLGVVDAERAARENKYADGVQAAHVTLQAQAAFAEIEERAASELPADLTVEQKIEWLDAQMAKELGPVALDPKARKIVGAMYSDYLSKFAGREVLINRRQNQAVVQDAWEVRFQGWLEGDESVDFGALIEEGAPVFDGGETEAWSRAVNMVAARAVAEKDASILDLLPATVTGADGSKTYTPLRTAENKAVVQRALDEIERYEYQKAKPAREWEKAEAIRPFEDRAQAGDRIFLPELKPLVLSGRLSESEAQSLVNRSHTQWEQNNKSRQEQDAKDAIFLQSGGKSWLDTEGVDGGSKNRAESQRLTDSSINRILTGWSESAGRTDVPTFGEDFNRLLKRGMDGAYEDPQGAQVVAQVIDSAKDWRLPHTPIKSWMDNINPAMGKTVLDRLDMYRLMKSSGVESFYVDESTQGLLEYALTAKRAGESDENIVGTIQRMADPTTQAYVKENRKALEAKLESGDVEVIGNWFDTDMRNVQNLQYVKARIRASGELFLSRNLPVDRAHDLARQRFLDGHFGVELNGKTYLVPNPTDVDPTAAKLALEEFSKGAAVLARSAGDPNPEAATLAVRTGVNGRGLEVVYLGSDGLELSKQPMSLRLMVEQTRRTQGVKFDDAVKASREKLARQKWLYQRNADKAWGRDILPQPKL